MKLTKETLQSLQRKLKTGNRRSVYLNAIPGNARYKFDIYNLSCIDENMANAFVKELLSKKAFKFKISLQNSNQYTDLLLDENSKDDLIKITKSFEKIIDYAETIELEKGINTFGFGFPTVIRRDRADNKLTVAPVLIWSLKIKKTKALDTWEIHRNEDDAIYLNEVLVNHLQSDIGVKIKQIPENMLEDGMITQDELFEIYTDFIKAIGGLSLDIEEFQEKLNSITKIGEKDYYEKLSASHEYPLIEFGGLFSIFEVQKHNIIKEYDELLGGGGGMHRY